MIYKRGDWNEEDKWKSILVKCILFAMPYLKFDNMMMSTMLTLVLINKRRLFIYQCYNMYKLRCNIIYEFYCHWYRILFLLNLLFQIKLVAQLFYNITCLVYHSHESLLKSQYLNMVSGCWFFYCVDWWFYMILLITNGDNTHIYVEFCFTKLIKICFVPL